MIYLLLRRLLSIWTERCTKWNFFASTSHLPTLVSFAHRIRFFLPYLLFVQTTNIDTKKVENRHFWFQGLCQCQSCFCARFLELRCFVGARIYVVCKPSSFFLSSWGAVDHYIEPCLPKYAYMKGVIKQSKEWPKQRRARSKQTKSYKKVKKYTDNSRCNMLYKLNGTKISLFY